MPSVAKILIADDEPRMCESLRLLLSNQGFDIVTTTSGREAMTLISREGFDLALLDIVMPDATGHQIMDHIKNASPETIVIAVTGHASLDSALGALRRGAYDYLRKPFEYEELLQTVHNALGQKRLKTEKAMVDSRLELSEERYRYLVQNSPDIIYMLDREEKFTFVSDAVERLLGYRSQDLVGMHYTSIVFGEDREKAKWYFNERRTGTRAANGVELRLLINPESERSRNAEAPFLTVELKSTGMYDKASGDKTKRLLGTHGVARDISRRKRLEARLQQAQKMETIGTLAGGIAHNFNNLLMAIQGYASLMLLNTDPSHPHYDKLKSIEQYIQSGADLTKQLLGFARGGKYDVKPIDINDLVARTVKMFGGTKKEIAIHENYRKDLRPVDADQGQIEQVLLNLLVNAWQAMPGGGELFLETRNVDMDPDAVRPYNLSPGIYVKISVTDTGIGMDEKTQRRIFEPFFTTKEMGRGTGLGLASAYGIIKNHNGIIDVVSRKGEGSTFTIYLPASKAAVRKEDAAAQGEILKGPETVLFVDDEDMIVEVGAEILKALGYRVLTAKGGREAVELYRVKSGEIGIVILDMIMPGMGGGETYDALRKINPHVKVLLSSGYSIKGEASDILSRGCNGFIQKPFNIKALSMKIREILDGPQDRQ
jgi:PAS domain S-box-containing protein